MSYVQNSKKTLKMLVSELEQSQEQPGNTSETFMSSQDHSDGARKAPYVEILKIMIFCLINDLRRTFFKWTMETSIYDCLLHFAYFKDPY